MSESKISRIPALINGDRLWQSLAEMAKIGATAAGGVCRLALTDLDKQARDLFVSWCHAAGCKVSVDGMGNVFARREGLDSSLPCVMTGSHLDTQPTGGRFDGVYGVLAGLEVIRTLNDHAIRTRAALEVVVWTNEEGTRFSPAMIASGVFAGVFDLHYGLSRSDLHGVTIGQELERIGYAGKAQVGQRKIAAFYETHIEQGPLLETSGNTIGAVFAAHGQRWYDITITGQEAHAGPTPMARRRDALVGASRLVLDVNRIGLATPLACATVGNLRVSPNSRNTVPGLVRLSVDLRHPGDDVLSSMDSDLRRSLRVIAEEAHLKTDIQEIWHSPAVQFDPTCVQSVRAAAEQLALPHQDIVSGAGHDACYLNRVAPTGMIFVPCKDGISHNEAEVASKDDVAAGAQVLLCVMLDRAGFEFPVECSQRPTLS
jgi:beta-ureidopropionase / N-carbamoyl-L-amino-acid hydrolase